MNRSFITIISKRNKDSKGCLLRIWQRSKFEGETDSLILALTLITIETSWTETCISRDIFFLVHPDI